MTTRDRNDREGPAAPAAGMAGEGERFLEALDHALAKQEVAEYQPTPEELRAAEPDARYWRMRVNERRRSNLLAQAATAVELPKETLRERSREWLLERLAVLRDLGRQLPGGLQVAHRGLDARTLDEVSTEEIRSQVADLELALARELLSPR